MWPPTPTGEQQQLTTSQVTVAAAVVLTCSVVAGCASTGAVPRPFPVPRTAEVPPTHPERRPPEPAPVTDDRAAPAVNASRGGITHAALLETALALVGAPYRNGGSSPEGFDCSGFTQWVFARHGITLPRETREQYATGARVSGMAVAPGDLIFFSTVAPGASHVGIALDEDRFIHAPSSRGVVRVERRSSGYWQPRFVGARRVDAN